MFPPDLIRQKYYIFPYKRPMFKKIYVYKGIFPNNRWNVPIGILLEIIKDYTFS